MSTDAYGQALEQALLGMTRGPALLHPIVSAFLASSGGTIASEIGRAHV